MDRSKDWQLELLMEKLRSKGAQYKTLAEMSKTVRMTMLDNRFALDSVDKSQHQKCLDTLQHSIKVTSLQSMVERLESLTRQLGLKFVQGPKGVELFISSDMFYLEILLEPSGAVLDVKVHHDGRPEQQSCQELVACLARGDFADFAAQLEGFAAVYQLNAEKKVKARAFAALQALEADLGALAQLQAFVKEPANLLHKSPVGALERRRGGHPVRLTYFVSPYDLVDVARFDVDPMNVEAITLGKLGYSVTVCMEGSAAHKLQTSTLITVNKNHNGKSTPSYAQLTSSNSAVIPACFVLKLNKPMPMCATLLRQIYQITELECVNLSNTHALLGLITTHVSNGKMDSGANKGLFVTLPDQNHCYFMTENRTMDGVLVNSIPFTHPAHVAQILVILRQQALFNTIIASCIRPNSREDLEDMIMFEVSALSWTQISISLEHPIEESMATAEIDLSDISTLICRIHSPGTPPPANAPDVVTETATKHLNRSFSVPVTMRSVIRLWERQMLRKGHENFSLPLGPGDPGGRGGHPGNNIPDFGSLDGKMKQENSNGGAHGMNLPMMSQHNQVGPGMFLNETLMSSDNFSNFSTSNDTSAMLTNIELTNILSGGSENKPKRTKRKDEWKSSKRKGEDDLLDASSCDSTSRSTPLSQETCSEIPTPNSAFHSDFESLDPSELISDKSEYDNVDDIDVEEILSGRKKSPTLDISPSVSITPISSTSFSQNLISMSTNSSITITPIPLKTDKKSGKIKSSDDKTKIDKKRKRKREESPMGPPEKIPLKESPPLITPSSPNMIRKFSSSPTHPRKISSPNLLKSGSAQQSPKHSSSPKHTSTSGSGKPSMSTLKNAANSPSGKGENKKSSGKDSRGDKDKRSSIFGSSSSSSSNPVKKSSSSVKVRQLDLNEIGNQIPDGLISPTGLDAVKNPNLARKSKGLLAVIDKLKLAQSDTATDLSSKNKDTKVFKDLKVNNKIGENKNSEYMVKPSSDGMKITINKTRTKDSKCPNPNKIGTTTGTIGNSSLSGTGSPKTHTGLKPGVNSGPASKKPQQLSKSGSGSNLSNSKLTNKTVNKLSSSSSSSSLLKISSKSATDLRLKDRPKQPKSEKSFFNKERKGSPTQRDEEYKLKLDPYSTPLVVEGFVKQLDKKFQIPKLSARTAPEDKNQKITKNSSDNDKVYDLFKNDKYPIALPPGNKLFENSLRINSVSSPKSKDDFSSEDQSLVGGLNFPLSLSTKPSPIELSSSKFIAPAAPKDDKKEKKDDGLLVDYSKDSKVAFPSSPSVSVHIVKSPAPSPMINPSPHSGSSSITDDELMDEALVGIGK